jgi:hypothetical protein
MRHGAGDTWPQPLPVEAAAGPARLQGCIQNKAVGISCLYIDVLTPSARDAAALLGTQTQVVTQHH